MRNKVIKLNIRRNPHVAMAFMRNTQARIATWHGQSVLVSVHGGVPGSLTVRMKTHDGCVRLLDVTGDYLQFHIYTDVDLKYELRHVQRMCC